MSAASLHHIDSLRCECWCGQHIVRVPAVDVRHGLTLPCRDRRCVAMDKAARS